MIKEGDEVTTEQIVASLDDPAVVVYLYFDSLTDEGADVARVVHGFFTLLDVYLITDRSLVDGWFDGNPRGVVFERDHTVHEILTPAQTRNVAKVAGSIAEAKNA
jgi:hypothetical protein